MSRPVFASSIVGTLARQLGDEVRARKSSLQRAPATRRTDCDMIVVEPEADLVARVETQLVPELLRDHDLTLRSNSMSHTQEYN